MHSPFGGSVFGGSSARQFGSGPPGGAAPPSYTLSDQIVFGGDGENPVPGLQAERHPPPAPGWGEDEFMDEDPGDDHVRSHLRPVEGGFGKVMQETLHESLEVQQAVVEMESLCRERSKELLLSAERQAHNSVRHLEYRATAEELRAEASSWSLLWHLYGNPDELVPGGRPYEDEAHRTCKDLVCEAVREDPLSNRCARVVAWLEHVAAQEVELSDGAGARYFPSDGVWRETRRVLDAGGAGGAGPAAVVGELDPDAPSRQGRALHADNAKDEEQLMKGVWSLLRCGRLAEAQQLCRDCGQPWRAASLSGGGGSAPVPLGPAAAAQLSETERRELLAGEVEAGDAGAAFQRGLWKWTCYEAAEKAAEVSASTGGGAGGGRHEAAVFAAMCGHVEKVVPVCETWEDECWAHFRSWLELRVDVDQPQELADVFRRLEASRSQRVRLSRSERHHQVQRCMALGEWKALLGLLKEWVLGVEAGGGGDGDGGEGARCPPALMRFAAHVALWVRKMVPSEEGVPAEPSGVPTEYEHSNEFAPMQDIVYKLIFKYAIHLFDTKQYSLVPLYARSLRPILLDDLYAVILDILTERPPDLRRRTFALMLQYLPADAVPRIVAKVAAKSRELPSLGAGPLKRANTAEWLCLTPETYREAVVHCNLLCRDMCGGGDDAFGAAEHLLGAVLPEELLQQVAEGAFADAGIALECAAWRAYYGWLRQYHDRQERVERMHRTGAPGLSPEERAVALATGQALVQQGLQLVREGWLQLAGEGGGEDEVPGPDGLQFVASLGGGEGEGDMLGGAPLHHAAGELRAAMAAAVQGLGAAAAPPGSIEAEVYPQEGPGEGAYLWVKVDAAPGLGGAPALVAAAAAKAGRGLGLRLHTVDATRPAIARELCRALCIPGLLLRCMEVRAELAGEGPGGGGGVGREVVELVGRSEYALFDPKELQELLQMEREAVLAEMADAEA